MTTVWNYGKYLEVMIKVCGRVKCAWSTVELPVSVHNTCCVVHCSQHLVIYKVPGRVTSPGCEKAYKIVLFIGLSLIFDKVTIIG